MREKVLLHSSNRGYFIFVSILHNYIIMAPNL